jgi:NhaP-type Na+/H+ or K+/H+ antiporter
MEPFLTLVALIGIVVVVASLLSGALERSAVPVVVAFLALGALLGPWGLGLISIGLDSPILRVLATLALVLVLFSDAVTVDLKGLRSHRGLLLRVLGPGTLMPAIVIAGAARLLLDLPWPAAILLGAALASTDPVMLRSALRSPALPDPARAALRLETGMNDIVLLPVVVLAMAAMGGGAAHGTTGAPDPVRATVGLFVLGPLFGLLVGGVGIAALSWVRRRTGVRRDYESIYALGLAFCAFAAAEAVGGSGFVAAFAAGIVIDARDTELCDCFMEYGEATSEMFLLLTFVALGTALMWTGFGAVDARTLGFTAVALVARTLVLLPLLGGSGLGKRERMLIALLGPRGLSTLLLVLLPVFAGVAGARELFPIAALVVLASILVHGGAIAWLLRARGRGAERGPAILPGSEPAQGTDLTITLEQLDALRERGETLVIADARKDAAWYGEPIKVAGAIRIDPDDPVAEARARGVPPAATIAVYCA